ncbi:MAG: helix-turn-helix transcriptional regulator [Dysgonomonas sp.]|nr:helix-turn-helix transcriptional regulator [Dysgonomonas sp.]
MGHLQIQDYPISRDYLDGEKPIIEVIELPKGYQFDLEVFNNELVFVVEGHLFLSYGKIVNRNVTKGQLLLFTSSCKIRCRIVEDSSFTIFRLQYNSNFNECFSYKQLLKLMIGESFSELDNEQLSPVYYLTMNNCMWTYVDNLNARINDGIKSSLFFELKLQELFFLFLAYYPKEELCRFFKPMMYFDQEFSNIIINNYRNVKNVKELADLTNYSISGFEKKFKRVFNVPAGIWMRQQRALNIYHEIKLGEISFKNICFENGFSSLSHFNNYCKLHFGQTPGEIRNPQKNIK